MSDGAWTVDEIKVESGQVRICLTMVMGSIEGANFGVSHEVVIPERVVEDLAVLLSGYLPLGGESSS